MLVINDLGMASLRSKFLLQRSLRAQRKNPPNTFPP